MTSGLDCTSRWVIVVWLISWIGARRERSLVIAEVGARPRLRDGAVDGENKIGGVIGDLRETPLSTRTPRIVPFRSTTAMMASLTFTAAAARSKQGLDVGGCQQLVGVGFRRRGGRGWSGS